jgi:cell division protease FtsH
MTMPPAMREDHPPPGGRPRDEDRRTRKPLALWDRVKFLLLLALLWLLLLWSAMANNPLMSFSDGVRTEVRLAAWVFVLMGAEALRQLHYLISEHWAGYHRFWTHFFFGGFERASQRRVSDWSRFRVRRALTWLLWIVIIAVVAGKITHNNPVVALFKLPMQIWHALPFVLQIVAIMLLAVGQFAAIFWFLSRGGVDVYYPDDIETRFSDVWGQDHVLERVKENILYLENPEVIEERGGYVPGGILLWGPPGTGKTLMAEAVAGETGRPYVFVDPGAFINMFFGVGVLKVKGLFRKLRRLALRYGGVIVFFDEADSLGNRGMAVGGMNSRPAAAPAPHRAACNGFSYLSPDMQWLLFERAMGEGAAEEPAGRRARQVLPVGTGAGGGGMGGMGTLQALLTELSGLKKPRGFMNRYVRRLLGMRPKPPPKYRILVMMASNLPEALDPALLRPGRIDRIYKVGYPSKAGRVRTYEGYLAKVSHELTSAQIDKLATITPYATGATIKDLVNEALITAIRDGRDVITWQDMLRAKQLKELGPPEGVEYIERERHATAVHEACHALVAYRALHIDIDLATIEKGSNYLGMVKPIPPEDLFTQWRSDYEAEIEVFLASLAGERLFFGNDSSSGVSGDLETATTLASYMEGYWGMGSTVSSHSASRRLEVGAPGGGRSKGAHEAEAQMRQALADRIEDNLGRLLKRVEQTLAENRDTVLCIAHALETHKTVSGEDVAAVIEHRPGPLIDGRAYGDPAFVQRLREYHEAAVLAHREHGKLNVVLPAPALTAAARPGGAAWEPGRAGEQQPNGQEPGAAAQDPGGWVPDGWAPDGWVPGGWVPGGQEGGTLGQEPEDPGRPGPDPLGS